MDQGSTMKRSAVHNFAPTVTKFCVMWEGQALPHDTKFGNSRCEIVGRRVIFIWSLIHGLRWSGLIKAEPGGTKGDYVFLLAGCLWVMEIPGLSSKMQLYHLFTYQYKQDWRVFVKTFWPIFSRFGPWEGKITQYFHQIMFACYYQHQIRYRKQKWLVYLRYLQYHKQNHTLHIAKNFGVGGWAVGK